MRDVTYIDAREALTRRERTVDTLVTAIMWGAYVYLWLPLVSLAAWGLGVELAYDAMVRAGGAESLREALFWYVVLLVDVTLTVAVWSLANKWRFAGHNRRTAHERVADEALAAYFGVSPEVLTDLRTTQRIELDIDETGRPVVPGMEAVSSPADSRHHAA